MSLVPVPRSSKWCRSGSTGAGAFPAEGLQELAAEGRELARVREAEGYPARLVTFTGHRAHHPKTPARHPAEPFLDARALPLQPLTPACYTDGP